MTARLLSAWAALAAPVSAQVPAHVAPAGEWTPQVSESRCNIKRNLAGPGRVMWMTGEKGMAMNTASLELEVPVDQAGEVTISTDVRAVAQPSGRKLTGRYSRFKAGDGWQASIFLIVTFDDLDAIADSVQLDFERPFALRIDHPGFDELADRFATCDRALFLKAGADATVYDRMATYPSPLNRQVVFSDDRLKSAPLKGDIAVPSVVVRVAENGKPETCTAVPDAWSRDPGLNKWLEDTACRSLRFDPARDESKRKVIGYALVTVTIKR